MRFHDVEKKNLLLAGLACAAAIVGAIPYVVGYVLPFAAISGIFGYAWLYGCRVSKRERQYGRALLFVPLSLATALLALWVVEPKGFFSPVETHAKRSHTKADASDTRSMDATQAKASMDPWSEAFNTLYAGWYGRFFTIESRASFNFEHFRAIVLLSILLGAPAVFYVLYQKDQDAWLFELHREWRIRDGARQTEHLKELLALSKARHSIETENESLRASIQAATREIDRLKTREKYLTEGKPKMLETNPDGPDLDFL